MGLIAATPHSTLPSTFTPHLPAHLSTTYSPQVTIEFGTIVSEIDLACGSGAKSFKWLGLTAAARFASRAPHGTRRRREASSITANNVAYMPLEIVTEGTNVGTWLESIGCILTKTNHTSVASRVPPPDGSQRLSRDDSFPLIRSAGRGAAILIACQP